MPSKLMAYFYKDHLHERKKKKKKKKKGLFVATHKAITWWLIFIFIFIFILLLTIINKDNY
jgi:hypothetical protein